MGTANMIDVGNLTIFFINDSDCGCTAFSCYFPNKGYSHYYKVISAGLHLVSNPKFNLLRSFLVEIWKNAKVRRSLVWFSTNRYTARFCYRFMLLINV